jgi:hypothetical protein
MRRRCGYNLTAQWYGSDVACCLAASYQVLAKQQPLMRCRTAWFLSCVASCIGICLQIDPAAALVCSNQRTAVLHTHSACYQYSAKTLLSPLHSLALLK